MNLRPHQPRSVLLVGPVPPPVTGQSLANGVVLSALEEAAMVDVAVVDMAKPYSDAGLGGKLRRLRESFSFT